MHVYSVGHEVQQVRRDGRPDAWNVLYFEKRMGAWRTGTVLGASPAAGQRNSERQSTADFHWKAGKK